MSKQNLVISGMYLEMARAFFNQDITFTKGKNLESIDDIPSIVSLNIKFSQFACAIIFSISSLEAYANSLLYNLIFERFAIERFSNQKNFDTIQRKINEFKKKYSDDGKRENLFKKEILTKKINILYKCFDLKLLSESPHKEDQVLWENLEKLQSIRNELIHPKPNFIESKEFKEFFQQNEKEFQKKLLTPIFVRYKLFEGTPLYQPNITENVILDTIIFKYKADAIKEHLLLTSTEYNSKNVSEWGTRWIF